MKSFKLRALGVVLIFGMAAGALAGCSKVSSEIESVGEEVKEEAETLIDEAKEKAQEVINEVKDEFETIVSDAKAEAEKIEEVAEDDVKEAIDYFEEHIEEPFENSDVIKKMVSYANKIIAWGERSEDAAKHEITEIANNIHNLYEKTVKGAEELDSEVVTEIKTTVNDLIADVKADYDAVVQEYCKLFKK